jgi:hypothetical protein
MNRFDATDRHVFGASSLLEKRGDNETPFMLVPLDPMSIVEGVHMGDNYLAPDFAASGEMRETCPKCADTRLKLVLLQKGVKRAHLVCDNCSRCFDACYADGRSAIL